MYYEPMYDVARPYSFELNLDVLEMLDKEFAAEKLVTKYAKAIAGKSKKEIEGIGRPIFEEYARDLMKRALQLGEEYPDRTYEVLKMVNDRCDNAYKFALVPQRFLEIAYLSTQKLFTLPIMENSKDRLIYRLTDCLTYNTQVEKCGEEIANLLTCRHFCLTACESLHKDLEIDAVVKMTASMPEVGYCEFTVTRA